MSCTLHIRCKPLGDFNLLAQNADTVLSVKEGITRKKGIPKDKQTLTFEGLVLEDTQRLKDYGIKTGSALFLSLPLSFSRDINVIITLPSGPMINLRAGESSTVSNLKEQLQRLQGLPAQSYELVLGGALLKESQTLVSSGLKDGTHLTVLRYMSTEPANHVDTFEINVKDLAGKSFTLQLSPSATTEALKHAIESQAGLPVAQQRLMFEGKELEDTRTLADYRIQKESTIYLFPRLLCG